MTKRKFDSQSSGLAGTGLSLGDDILALDDGHDSTLLDGGGSLETVRGSSKMSDHALQTKRGGEILSAVARRRIAQKETRKRTRTVRIQERWSAI